jgi:hypothetical protein
MRTTMLSLDMISRLGLPVDFPKFFPPQLEQYRRTLAEGSDTPDEYAVAYMLAAAATAVGGDVSAVVKTDWLVRCNLFLALIGYKGSGKSTLVDKTFGPLMHREEELRDQATRIRAEASPNSRHDDGDADEDEDDADEDEREDDEESYGEDDEDGEYDEEDEELDRQIWHRFHGKSKAAELPDPCIVVNDTTGPALLRLLEENQRQILVNPDELSALFIRNTGGTDRQMWCELYDGRRRRRARVSSAGSSGRLDSPYVSILGGIQPDLLKCFYGSRGDDGLLDRMLLVGSGDVRDAEWPQDADDPVLNTAWSTALSRLLRIEALAEDAIGCQVESRFTPEALDICKTLMKHLNELVKMLRIHPSQRGIVKKLVQHALKLALLRRCLRWATGEFGERGPLGDVDADDAAAACEATLFFLGRWLLWRPELRGGLVNDGRVPVGLVSPPHDDPALQVLALQAALAHGGIRLIERVVRYTRRHDHAPFSIEKMAARGPFSDSSREELHVACAWLVERGFGEWLRESSGTFRLFTVPPLHVTEPPATIIDTVTSI